MYLYRCDIMLLAFIRKTKTKSFWNFTLRNYPNEIVACNSLAKAKNGKEDVSSVVYQSGIEWPNLKQ